MEDLEVLYSPSRWSKRFDQVKVQEKHVEFLNSKTAEVMHKIPCEMDVSYGLGPNEKFNIYGMDLGDGAPLLIHIHGGYYQETSLSYSNNGFISNIFHKNGIRTIVLGYDLSPEQPVEDILGGLMVGLSRCVEFAKVAKCSKIFISGHSVGAHAVATILPDLKRSLPHDEADLIEAVFLICGIYDLEPITKMSANALLRLTAERAKKISPILWPKLDYAETKVHVIAAENDSPAFVRQSKEFFEKLRNEGNFCELTVVGGTDHFDVVENLFFEEFELTQHMLKVMKEK